MEDERNLPIAAKLKGPGPARYALPSTCGFHQHDFSKHMKPAWTFGHRFWKHQLKSPGPVYYVHPEMTRNGKDGTPVYSMLGRQRDPNEFKTPAPCTYLTEQVHPQGERHAPAYTMGARFAIRRCDSNPAPNRYGLPQLLGSNQINKKSYPSYSMTSRSNRGCYSEDLARTPGPGQYQAMEPNVVYNRGPIYSLQSRTPMQRDKTAKPGPGQHHPEKVYINKRVAPAYSMGIRHSQYITPLIAEG